MTQQADRAAREAAVAADAPVDPDVLPQERERKFRTPGFSRMRFDWHSEDAPIIAAAKARVEDQIVRDFADAYEVMGQVYDLVRTAEVDGSGEPRRDRHGFVIWRRTPDGNYEEDFNRLGVREKEHLLFLITTRIFEWKQRAEGIWLESMMAKAQWEERFSIEYDAPMSGTIDDRTAVGKRKSTDERYFAIYMTAYSRRAEAIVASMELLGQRLKDSLVG